MSDKKTFVITIDGPSGAGKGTIAQKVAATLGFALLDSGALYRLVAIAVLRREIDPDDEPAVVDCAKKMRVRFESQTDQNVRILLDEMDVTLQLRDERTAAVASVIAVHSGLRQQLLQMQRDFCKPPGLVADGRDMGTVVFPDAEIKIFLTASAEIRAGRRLAQLKEKGIDANIGGLLEEILKRDARDSEREIAPLKPAADSIVIDSSALGIEEVSQQILEIVGETLKK